MTLPLTTLSAARPVTRAVTPAEAAVLAAVHVARAVYAGHLTDLASVRSLLALGALHCRDTRVGQVVTLSPTGYVLVGQSEHRRTSTSVATNLVYHRAALQLAAARHWTVTVTHSALWSEVTDGERVWWLLTNASSGGPTPATLKTKLAALNAARHRGG
ncbi:hypothetical protein [Deinococcus multiflagellatus]|uniref:Uncharacterized protein n=2 Tax=Deinococcus multiflagellatus TaxID=1656887 RepID=A0ABW1ZVB5_9DEIO